MYIGVHVQYPLFLSEFNETWIFKTDFEKYPIIKFYEIHPVGAELFHADRQTDGQPDTWTDMMMLTVAFCNSATGPKNYKNIGLLNEYNKVYSQHNTTLFLVCRCQVLVENSDFQTFH